MQLFKFLALAPLIIPTVIGTPIAPLADEVAVQQFDNHTTTDAEPLSERGFKLFDNSGICSVKIQMCHIRGKMLHCHLQMCTPGHLKCRTMWPHHEAECGKRRSKPVLVEPKPKKLDCEAIWPHQVPECMNPGDEGWCALRGKDYEGKVFEF